jgi:hypothetical protein
MLQGSYYFVSHHNTVLYIDEDSNRLRHAPLGTARLNFLLELNGDRAQLMVTGRSPSEKLPASFALENDEIRVYAGAPDLACVVERLPGDEVAIRIGERYVTADLDWVARNSRDWCREWERYHLASADAARPEETATRERVKISGFVISYNRAAIIETCLRSLRFVDELVVVDKSSTDGTLEIAQRYADKVVVVPWTPTADDTRSYAIDLCSHDMIVYLDDDECLSPEAIRFILEESANPSAEVYRLPFHSYCFGLFDKRWPSWPEYHERFFRRGALEFTPIIHSNLSVKSSKVKEIPADSPIFVHHLSCAGVNQWLEKVIRYTSQPERAGWSHKSIPLSADLVRRQTDYWFGGQEAARDDHVAAYALLRIVYDIVDRLKQWEAAAGIDGDKAFAEICLGLQAEYDQLEQSLGWRGKPGGRRAAGV